MRKWLVVWGGTGSSFLIKQAQMRYGNRKVVARPDVIFHHAGLGEKNKDLKVPEKHTYQTIETYDEYPDKSMISVFKKRSGFTLDKTKTIEKNMEIFIAWLKKKDKYVVLSEMFLFEFFSRHNVDNLIFLVRHPLHSYVSVTKEIRHGEYVEAFGGLNTKEAVEWYAGIWNLFVTEGFKTNSSFIKYEFPGGYKEEWLKSIFKKWEPRKRNYDVLKPDLEEYLKELVEENFYKIYRNWDV